MKNIRLQQELDDLRTRFNISLGDLTADEIATFVDCCRRIESPYGDANGELIETPVTVRGVRFFPLTIGASVWLDQYAGKWWPDDRRYFWAMAYAMANAHDPDAFADARTETAALKKIVALSIRLCFSRAALKKAMDICLGVVEDVPPDPKIVAEAETDWSAIVARLETQSGIKRDEWVWGRTARYAVKAYYDLRRFAREAGPDKAGRAKDELDDAINALARLKKSIRDRIEGGANG